MRSYKIFNMGFFSSLFGKKDELHAAAGAGSAPARNSADQIKLEIEKYEGELDSARQQAVAHPQLAEHFQAIVRAKEQQVAAAEARLARAQNP